MKNPLVNFSIWFASVVLFNVNVSVAHEFETNHIERSIDVLVRDQKVEVKYSLGLSDSTIVDWLVEQELIDQTEETRFRKCIADLESLAKEEVSSTENGKKESKNSKLDARETSGERFSASNTNKAAEDSPEPAEFQFELLKLLREKLSGKLVGKLELNANGESLNFSEVAVSNSARHHVALEILLKASLSDAEKTELVFVDRNFLDFTVQNDGAAKSGSGDGLSDKQKLRYFGNIRLACRTKGAAVQINSNVAPVIARAKPINIESLDQGERVEAATIRTNIAFAKSKPKQ